MDNTKPMKTENDEEKKFKLKSYGKSELAALYLPDIAPRSAADVLNLMLQAVERVDNQRADAPANNQLPGKFQNCIDTEIRIGQDAENVLLQITLRCFVLLPGECSFF